MPTFWVREFLDGVLRIGGEAVKEGLRDGRISNRDIFFEKGTPIVEVVEYLAKKGVKV